MIFRRLRFLLKYVREGLFPPKPVRGLDVKFWSKSMKLARLRVFWEKSPSNDVVQYNVIVINEDTQEVLEDRVVSFAETQLLIDVLENTNITATVVANDGTFDSEPVSTSYSVGDLTAPAPVGFVGVELVEIVEVEDDEPVDVVEGGENQNDEGTDVVDEVVVDETEVVDSESDHTFEG